jgi:hypothetical protein
MGCEPVLKLAATPDEAVSIICTIVDKTILLTLWGKLMYVSYTTDRPVFSRASSRCSSYNLSLDSFDMVDLRLWDALSRWPSSWRVFTCPMCMPIIFWTGHINSCMSWSITDHYIIKWHVCHAWYWFWTIKALVEAVVLWWLCSNLRGRSSSVDHCQTFSVSMIILAKTLFLRQKCFIDTGCVCTSSVASKKSRHWTIGKNPFLEKKPIGQWCSPVHHSYCITLH